MSRRDTEAGEIRLATLRRMLPFFRGHFWKLSIGLGLVLLITGATILLPLVFRRLIDEAIPSGMLSAIITMGLAYLGLLTIQGVMQFFQSLMLGYVGIDIVNSIKLKMMRHVLGLSLRFFDKHPPGVLISRIESDAQKLFMLFSEVGTRMLGAVLTIIFALVVMGLTNIRLTLYVLATAPVYLVAVWVVFKRMRPMFRKDRALYARIPGFLGEHIRAIPLLRNLNQLPWSVRMFEGINRDKRDYEAKIFLIEQAMWTILMIAPHLSITAILNQSVSWLEQGTITLGTVWMFVQYIQMAVHPLIMISEQIGEIQRSFGAADRLFFVLDTHSEIQDPEKPVPREVFQDAIRFENVSFQYEPGKPVLRDVSFTIKKGSTIAIVGPTGSGKTTIISLLARFYDPDSGRITLDGHDLRDMRVRDLRERISLVLQDIFLFPGTLMDNLRTIRSDISDEQVKKAVQTLGIEHHVLRMRDGYDTILTEEGANLSFGERQLFSFARALVQDPQILIMDEATSSVDPYTESEIQKSMDNLLTGRTAIIVAHRLSTVRHADRILVLEQGRVVEQGSHDELIAAGGRYAELYHSQTGFIPEPETQEVLT